MPSATPTNIEAEGGLVCPVCLLSPVLLQPVLLICPLLRISDNLHCSSTSSSLAKVCQHVLRFKTSLVDLVQLFSDSLSRLFLDFLLLTKLILTPDFLLAFFHLMLSSWCYSNLPFLQLTSNVCGSPTNVLDQDPLIQPNVPPLVFAWSCRAKTSEMEIFILFLPFFIQLTFFKKKILNPWFLSFLRFNLILTETFQWTVYYF